MPQRIKLPACSEAAVDHSEGSEKDFKRSKVIPWPKRSRESKSELSRLLKQDKELGDFYRFVHDNGLRERAVELLTQRISQDENGI